VGLEPALPSIALNRCFHDFRCGLFPEERHGRKNLSNLPLTSGGCRH
jgi:hypothetical protein